MRRKVIDSVVGLLAGWSVACSGGEIDLPATSIASTPGDESPDAVAACLTGRLPLSACYEVNRAYRERPSACQLCAGNNCCNEFSACERNPICLACINFGASYELCQGVSLFQALNRCTAIACSSSCDRGPPFGPTPSGAGLPSEAAVCDSGFVVPGSTCGTCLSGKTCCGAFQQCGQSPSCAACLLTPTDAVACGIACEADAEVQTVKRCANVTCSQACEGSGL